MASSFLKASSCAAQREAAARTIARAAAVRLNFSLMYLIGGTLLFGVRSE
jgi:hypothetical protein